MKVQIKTPKKKQKQKAKTVKVQIKTGTLQDFPPTPRPAPWTTETITHYAIEIVPPEILAARNKERLERELKARRHHWMRGRGMTEDQIREYEERLLKPAAAEPTEPEPATTFTIEIVPKEVIEARNKERLERELKARRHHWMRGRGMTEDQIREYEERLVKPAEPAAAAPDQDRKFRI